MLLFDPNNLEGSKIDISLEVGSINTKNERRDNHLRTDDFFNAEEFPTMKFVSTEIRSTGENAYVAVGELTIKETTKTIELPFKLLGVMADPRDENTTIAGFSAETKILRNEYGVGSGDYIQTAVIGDEVTIEINLEVRNTK
jgi:polyisoprenoid-binding protein YceI